VRGKAAHPYRPKRPKKLSNNPPPELGGDATATRGGGAGALGSGRTGIARVAASMKRPPGLCRQ